MVDARARARKQYDDNIAEVRERAKIANAQFKTSWRDTYPDATSPLRPRSARRILQNSQAVPGTPRSTTPRARAEHGNEGEFRLPIVDGEEGRARQRQDALQFVMTADIIGGNSGSPVVTSPTTGRRHHLRRQHPVAAVGLPVRRAPGPRRGVHSAGILDALKKVYGVSDLVKELTGK